MRSAAILLLLGAAACGGSANATTQPEPITARGGQTVDTSRAAHSEGDDVETRSQVHVPSEVEVPPVESP